MLRWEKLLEILVWRQPDQRFDISADTVKLLSSNNSQQSLPQLFQLVEYFHFLPTKELNNFLPQGNQTEDGKRQLLRAARP